MYDFIYACLNYKGELVDWINQHDYNGGEDIDSILKNVIPAFKYFPIPISEIEEYKLLFEKEIDGAPKYLMDLNNLQSVIGDDKLLDEFQGDRKKILLPTDIDYKALIKIKSEVNNPILIDKLAWSSGISTVGSAATYPTLAEWADDGPAPAANISANAGALAISDFTETAAANIDWNVNGFSLVVDSNNIHNGNTNRGWTITKNTSNVHLFATSLAGTGIFEIKNLHTVAGEDHANGYAIIEVFNTTAFTGTFKVHDNFFDGNDKTGIEAMHIEKDTPSYEIWDNVMWGNPRRAIFLSAAFTMKFENNNIHDCGVGIKASDAVNTFNSTLFSNNTTNIENNTNTISNNCGTDAGSVGAATDNNPEINLTIADEVASTSDTNKNFMRTLIGSNLDGAGASAGIGAHTTDIRGIALASPPSIGAFEAATYDVIKTIGTDARDYTRPDLWEADLDNAEIYGANDDAIGDMYNDSAFNDNSFVFTNGETVGVNSIVLKAADGEEGDGTAGTGVRYVMTGAFTTIIECGLLAIPIIIEDIEFDGDGESGCIAVSMGNATQSRIFRRLLVHDFIYLGTAQVDGIAAKKTGSVNNCTVYNLTNDGSTGDDCIGIQDDSITGETSLWNNTVYNIINNNEDGDAFGIQFEDAAGELIQNNIVCNVGGSATGTKQCYSNDAPGSATVDHNLASDTSASGTGSLNSKTAADQFKNITPGSEDLRLKAGADAIDVAIDLGTTDGVNFSIDGRDRDAEGDTWDMGSSELVGALIIGSFALDLPAIESAFTGIRKSVGSFASDLPAIESDFIATRKSVGSLDTTLPIIESDFSGVRVSVGSFAFNLPSVESSFSGVLKHVGSFALSIPIFTVSFSGGIEQIEELVLESIIVTSITLKSYIDN